MSTLNENIYIKSYELDDESSNSSNGKVKLLVNFENLINYNKNYKTCSINNILEKQIQHKNLIETDIILDKTTLSQLKPKFIKSLSKSEWSELNIKLKIAFEDNNIELIKLVALKFSEGLQIDLDKLNKNQPISDCALFVPRYRSTYNRPENNIRIVNEIINIMFIDTQIVKILDAGKIKYAKIVSKLSKSFVDQYTQNFLSNNKFKLFRLLEHDKKNWSILKNKEFSKVVIEPTAMPVKVSPLEELKPFFNFLNSNSVPIDNDWEKEPCMKFTRGALYQNKRLDLCKQVVGPTWIEMLMKSLVNNNQIEHFLLGNNIIGSAGGKAIGQFLLIEHKPKIKTWYLAGNDLDEEGIRWICDGLKFDKDCESLWLKRNPIKSEGIKYISEMLKTNIKIKILDLHNTAVFDDGLKYLIDGLKVNYTLRHLYLDANGITKIGIDYLADYFNFLVENNLEGISSLWLDMNKIEDDGAIKLFKSLKNYKYLKRLVFGSNALTDKSMQTLVDSFINHSNLIVLDLGMYKSTSDMGMITNCIGDEGINILSKLIENNKSIKYLSVVMNGLTIKGIEIIANSIEKSYNLMYMDYTQYSLEINQKLNSRIKSKLEENRLKSNFTRKLKNLKHGENIHLIDSIYRNNMK